MATEKYNEKYVEVLLPLATDPLTYRIGDALLDSVKVGSRVVVSVVNKLYTGVVIRVHDVRPAFKTINVRSVFDPFPIASPQQIALWQWIASYYMCPLGMVLSAALPSGLKAGSFSEQDLARESFRPRQEPYVMLDPGITSEAMLNQVLDSLKRAKEQQRAVMQHISLCEQAEGECFSVPHIPIRRARIDVSDTVIRALVSKGVFALSYQEVSGERAFSDSAPLPELTAEQQQALETIDNGLQQSDVALLHGVTGSGKTEIYIHLIERALNKGNNVLYLLPEIALTSQLIERLGAYFGERVITYHSGLTANNRAEIYRNLARSQDAHLIVGVRSSVLLPTPRLGLVIVDEEHDSSFKQSDSAPRYHARDTAIMLASLYGAKTLLGSATPSIESYFNALKGKYTLATLTQRYSGVSMPEIFVSDTMRAAKRGERVSHFNKLLIDKIDRTLVADNQVILFQNRRGFSPYVECGSCAESMRCPHCNVTLTYHKMEDRLKCHYCGYNTAMPRKCPKCNNGELLPQGFGTEKIEQELQKIFPDAVIDRLDADTAKSKSNFKRLISDFKAGRTDVLIGTQMVSKGFDFDKVALVGVLNADNMINYPDFRSAERAFQMIMQVGGRAGRRESRGEVVIQTTQVDNPVIRYIRDDDYQAMVAWQLSEREAFLYPPFCRLIRLSMSCSDRAILWSQANALGASLRKIFGLRLLGPEAPIVDRIADDHIVEFILKIERTKSVNRAKELLKKELHKLTATRESRKIRVTIDVDPQ